MRELKEDDQWFHNTKRDNGFPELVFSCFAFYYFAAAREMEHYLMQRTEGCSKKDESRRKRVEIVPEKGRTSKPRTLSPLSSNTSLNEVLLIRGDGC